jgi:hypothetical protein
MPALTATSISNTQTVRICLKIVSTAANRASPLPTGYASYFDISSCGNVSRDAALGDLAQGVWVRFAVRRKEAGASRKRAPPFTGSS